MVDQISLGNLSLEFLQGISKTNEPKTRFLGLVLLEDSSTGQVLHDKVIEFIFSQGDFEALKKNFMVVAT